MKKLLLFLTIFGFAFTLVACDPEEDTETPTCETGEVYNEETEECETEVPTCTGDQVLNEETNTCEDPADPVTLTFVGVMDTSVEQDDEFNVLTGVSISGSDGNDYTTGLTATTPDCYIDSNNLLDTSNARTCIVEYSGVGAGAFIREQITVTITQPVFVYPDDFGPDLMTWDFEEEADLDGFGIYTAGGGAIDMSLEDGAMKLVTASGGQRYETRLDYMGLQLEEGEYYYWQFDAKSSIDGKKVHLNFGQLLSSDPWFAPFKVEGQDIITLTDEWATYSIYFIATDLNDIISGLDGGPLFEMGNIEGSEGLDATIWIDNMIIAGGSGVDVFAPVLDGVEDQVIYLEDNVTTFDPLAGVTAMDNIDGDITSSISVTGHTVDPTVAGVYLVTYKVYDSSGNGDEKTAMITVMSDTTGPEVLGADNVVIEKGSEFDLAAGVTAVDGRDGDVTASIVIGGDTLDTSVGGVYNITYTATDALGNETVFTRTITVEAYNWAPTDLVTNGSFDAGYWNPFYATWTAAKAYYSITEGGEMMIDIMDVGPDNWSVLIEQDGIDVVSGKTYRMTFDAYADAARTIQAEIAGIGTPVDVAITDTLATYTIDFAATADGTHFIKFLMGNIAGAGAGQVYLDNVKVEEFDGAAVVADTDQVMDGDFEGEWVTDGWSSWSRDWDPVITSSLQVEYSEAVFRYDGVGDAHWNNQLNFEGIPFVNGETYKVVFKAKGDAARGFTVSVFDGAQDFRSEVFDLGTDFATFSYYFTYNSEVATSKLSFELGSVFDGSGNNAGTTFYLDEVMIYQAVEEEQPFWTGYGMTVDEVEGVATVTYDVQGNWWESNIQGMLDSFDGTNKSVEFTFTGEAGHDYIFKVEGDGGASETRITASGTEETVIVALNNLTEAQRNQINKFIVFDVTAGAGTLVVNGYTLSPTLPPAVWNGYGADTTLTDNLDGTFTYGYNITTQYWWDWSAQYEYGVYDGTTFNAVDLVFTGEAGIEYKLKIETIGKHVEVALIADGNQQTLTASLADWSDEDRSNITKLVVFTAAEGNVTPVVGSVTYEIQYSTVAVATETLADMPNQDFTDTDISGWGTEGTLTLSHDAMGYMLVNVTELGNDPWSQNIGFGGQRMEAGNTYTVSYTIKTSFVEGRTVTFFAENATYAKYYEVVETLTDGFQTFTYTFDATETRSDIKVGIFFGNAGGSPMIGEVVIDSIVITEAPTAP